MLNHQANISDILIELYNPIVGKKETGSTVRRTKTSVQSMKAIEEFQKTIAELRDILLPELVDDFIILIDILLVRIYYHLINNSQIT